MSGLGVLRWALPLAGLAASFRGLRRRRELIGAAQALGIEPPQE